MNQRLVVFSSTLVQMLALQDEGLLDGLVMVECGDEDSDCARLITHHGDTMIHFAHNRYSEFDVNIWHKDEMVFRNEHCNVFSEREMNEIVSQVMGAGGFDATELPWVVAISEGDEE